MLLVASVCVQITLYLMFSHTLQTEIIWSLIKKVEAEHFNIN